MIEPLLISSSFLLGKDLVTKAISNTSNNIFSEMETIMADGDFVFKSLLENLDINSKLEIINSFVNDIEPKIHNETIKMTLKYLHDILEKIKLEIENIRKEIDEHKQKYFYYLRTPSYKDTLKKLSLHVKILDERFNLLIKLINSKK